MKILDGDEKNLSRQDRIEKLAYENFQLYVPAPESLIVYVGDVKWRAYTFYIKPGSVLYQ